jgi:DNA primase small subunit
MGKTLSLDGADLEWARGQFRQYYSTEAIALPARFTRREFAAFPFTTATLMRRHEAFRSAEAFRGFLARDTPRHVYYSSAYYRTPDAPNMAAKEWLGADLIFDLDADHLRRAERLDFPSQLLRVRERVRDLYDDFLIGDFGVDPEQTHLVFSGGRGYHVHVQDPRFQQLTSPERRELVDYILGTGLEPATAIQDGLEPDLGSVSVEDPNAAGAADEPGPGPRRRARRFKRLQPPDAPGWRGRITRALNRLLLRWEGVGPEQAQAELESLGVPKKEAKGLVRQLLERGHARQILEGQSLDVFPRDVPKDLLETVLRVAAIELQGETDAPVTTDIHRLIRLPGSLHGGTGFRVVPLTRDRLDDFDPFREATIPLSEDRAVSVEFQETVDYPFPPASVHGTEGEVREIPVGAALFLILRGEATLRP